MTRRRQPADLDVWLHEDFEPLMELRGYNLLEAKPAWLARGAWNGSWSRETTAGSRLTRIALTRHDLLDTARYQVVVRPAGETRVLASLLLNGDIDADFGYVEGDARDTVAVTGSTYMAIFDGVLITPDATDDVPVGSISTYATRETDLRTGPAEVVALGYIADHLGPAAPIASRRFERLVIPEPHDPPLGSTVSLDLRFPTLLEGLRRICEEGGITVDLRASETPGLVDVVVTAQVLRPEVAFSRATSTLSGLRVHRTASGAHRALVAGPGEGLARTFTTVLQPPPVGGWAFPHEIRVDATSDAELEKLQAAGAEELAALNPPVGISLSPSPASRWLPGEYEMGDRLPVVEGDAEFELRVEEIVVRHEAKRSPSILPQVGQPDRNRLAGVLNRFVRALRRSRPS